MLRNSSWNLAETNLAEFGSEREREHRKEEGSLEQAWNYEGSPIGSEPGLWVWRVKDFSLVPVPESKVNPNSCSLYQGDSYVFLKSTPKPNSKGLNHHIHFWLGRETTQDEAGTAAYKTVELDDFLDTLAIQHREVQYKESALFRGYFKSLQYLQGGFPSGFNHVEEEESPKRLLRVSRSASREGESHLSRVIITEVPLDYQSLRSNAVFVLDTGDKIYQWQGAKSSAFEKAKAAEYIAQLISERNGRGESIIIEQNTGSEREFWEALGSEGEVAEDDENEQEEKEEAVAMKRLFRLCSTGPFGFGHLKFELVAEDKISKDMFESKHVYIFDIGHQVYTWIGSEAHRKERRAGLQYAQDYIKHSGKSPFTPICKVVEGAEDELFESSLEGWQGW